MKKNLFWVSLFATVASILLFTATFAMAAEQEQGLKVGKKGEITFNAETKVGDLTLKPGRYVFQHRVEGSDHFVHFTEVTKQAGYAGAVVVGVPKAHPGEVKCRLEPLKSKASGTAIYSIGEDGSARVTKIIIRGENVAHVF